MKNFKEFLKDFNEGMTSTATDMSFAYAAYCQGYAEAKSEIAVFNDGKGNYFPIMPTFPVPEELTKPTCDTQAQLLPEEAEKMKVYPEQLAEEYTPESLKEIQKAMAGMRNLSEEERKAEFARQIEKLKQDPTSVLHATAMQKAAEKPEVIEDVIIIPDKIKEVYPELKNLKMIQKESPGVMTWKSSVQYAKTLNLGDFTDWRLPTIDELRGIYRAKQALGIADDVEWYWSGEEAGASLAWYVGLRNGNVYYSYKNNTNCVYCVR